MITPRIRHATALLADGRVLVAGGSTDQYTPISKSELYNPTTDTWTRAANMPVAVEDAAAVTLPDGTVLVAGGSVFAEVQWDDGIFRTTQVGSTAAQLYHPATNTWTMGPDMPATGDVPTFAATLPDGNVFFFGYSASEYNPATSTWTALATPPARRSERYYSPWDTAQLPNGDIVTLRAMQYTGSMPGTPTTGPAVYHWASNTWTVLPTPPQNPGDSNVALAALPDGNVMLAGGMMNYLWFPSSVGTVMEVNPTTGVWTIDANMMPRNFIGTVPADGELVALPNGSILDTGGNSNTDLDFVYSPTARTWTQVPGRNADNATFTALADGTVLTAGGYSDNTDFNIYSAILDQAAIFTP